jgi:hypothetical protein
MRHFIGNCLFKEGATTTDFGSSPGNGINGCNPAEALPIATKPAKAAPKMGAFRRHFPIGLFSELCTKGKLPFFPILASYTHDS